MKLVDRFSENNFVTDWKRLPRPICYDFGLAWKVKDHILGTYLYSPVSGTTIHDIEKFVIDMIYSKYPNIIKKEDLLFF